MLDNIPNLAAQQDGFFIPTNMRVPAASVIRRLFGAEPLTDGDRQECLSQWESRGKTLGRWTADVTGRKVGDRAIAMVQAVKTRRAKTRTQGRDLLTGE